MVKVPQAAMVSCAAMVVGVVVVRAEGSTTTCLVSAAAMDLVAVVKAVPAVMVSPVATVLPAMATVVPAEETVSTAVMVSPAAMVAANRYWSLGLVVV